MGKYTHNELVDLIGRVAAMEYSAASDACKPGLDSWISKLRGLSAKDFFKEAQLAIFNSATCNSLRGNHEDEHCKASAVFFESERRHRALGHARECGGAQVYDRAYSAVARIANLNFSLPPKCTCGLEGD